jgi:hypothetical protein
MMGNRLHVRHDPGVVSDYNGHNEYPLVPLPIFVPPSSDGPTHLCLWQRIFLPSRIVHNIDDRIESHDLPEVLGACVSGSSLATVRDETHDEPVDNVHLASMGDGVACAVVEVLVGGDAVGGGDNHGDCNTVPVLHENRNAHRGNNSVRGGKLVVVDQWNPIDLVVCDGVGLEE